MNRRRSVIGAVLILLSLPAVLVAIEWVSFHVRNRSNGSLVSSGREREYLLYVPRSYDRTRPTPLVISMHGAGGWPVQHRDISLWNRLADEHGFIVVYPSGIGRPGPRVWHAGPTDVRFISELIDKLQAEYNIDPRRVYANGLSNGGGMSFFLSCRLSDRIAAVGLVASAQTEPWSWCKNERAVPMIAFHGTADRFTPYEGGTSVVAPRPFPSIPKWAANWARRNRCEAEPVDSAVAADVTRREYTNCAGNAAVLLYTIQGGGHTWPGGQDLPEWFAGPNNRSVDASREMWAFFSAHALGEK